MANHRHVSRGSRVALVMLLPALFAFETRATEPVAPTVVEPAAVRWSEKGIGGEPQFSRHVVPLVGKLGCNNRACHGSFQGQNGFRLSLFGHDAKMDHDELTLDEGHGPRVNVKDAANSLAILKPSGQTDHDGGELFVEGSWQYRLLLEWIKAGAKADGEDAPRLERVVVDPAEVRLAVAPADKKSSNNKQRGKTKSSAAAKSKDPSSAQLTVTAYYSDGTCEDVTSLTLFSTNDDVVAQVTDQGTVSAIGPGDTAIVAVYAGYVVTMQTIVPFAGDKQITGSDFVPQNPLDEFVLAKLNKLGIQPSARCSDSEFLRRAHLDLIGTLPTSDEAREFLADKHPDKRARLVDRLLNRPEYGMYWATRFSDWTGNDNRFTPQPREKTGWLWHDWLRDKLDRNVPYDELVGGFLTATTREGRPVEEVAADYRTIRDNITDGFDDGTYAHRQTNDIFWLKSGNSNPETLGLQVAYAFLGVRLECAQCHKHPFDRWTQDDFKSFSTFFAAVSRGTPDDVPEELTQRNDKNQFRYTEVYVRDTDDYLKQVRGQLPRPLGEDPIELAEGGDPREALWQWMRSPDNQYFAPAIVNRLWGHYFGVGIVNPVDDFNAANPASNPQLLQWLARDFIDSGFDLKHLHRRILNSRTYQTTWVPNDSNRLDERNFSHALLRRMPAEVVMDAINQVTGGEDQYSSNNAPRGVKTINLALSRLRGGGPEYVLGIFGRPLRTQTCDCERSGETGLAQAMYLLNDTDVNSKINDAQGRLAKLEKQIDDDGQLIDELYLSTLSRYPSAEEKEKALAFVDASDSRKAGMQDVLWSLINLREFIFIH